MMVNFRFMKERILALNLIGVQFLIVKKHLQLVTAAKLIFVHIQAKNLMNVQPVRKASRHLVIFKNMFVLIRGKGHFFVLWLDAEDDLQHQTLERFIFAIILYK